jgi:hypothetical protein
MWGRYPPIDTSPHIGIVWVVGCQCSRVLPQKPIITQLIKNSPSFYGKLYITVSIRDQAGHIWGEIVEELC